MEIIFKTLTTAKTYGLSNLKPVNNLSYNYVLSGFQDTKAIILKLGLDIDGFKREAAALRAFEGFGGVQVFSENIGLLLLECAVPGVSLKSYFPENDDKAINITANVIKRLHKAPIPSTHAFSHIKDWLAALDKDWNIPYDYLQKARKLARKLVKTGGPDVLLHGDLHHDNILQNGDDKSRCSSQSEDGWLVIDPKGVIGEPAYEVAAFIRNPPTLLAELRRTSPNAPLSTIVLAKVENIILNRITHFAKILELSERRIIEWCFVQAVLAWVWALEDLSDEDLAKADGCDIRYFEQLTEILHQLFDCMLL